MTDILAHPAETAPMGTAATDLSGAATQAYRSALDVIAAVEPRIADATRAELADQRASLKLIASENYASPAVLLTMGTWMSDKYAEDAVLASAAGSPVTPETADPGLVASVMRTD